jgi:hypothetical protein
MTQKTEEFSSTAPEAYDHATITMFSVRKPELTITIDVLLVSALPGPSSRMLKYYNENCKHLFLWPNSPTQT